MRRWLSGGLLLGLLACAGPAQGQLLDPATADPFTLYYGWYLPQQAALAARPRVSDSLMALSAARQRAAQTERAALYDPVAGYGISNRFDPNAPFADRQRYSRGTGGLATMGTNVNGTGPGAYYNRASAFFPGLRPGRGVNPSTLASPIRPGGGAPSSGGYGIR